MPREEATPDAARRMDRRKLLAYGAGAVVATGLGWYVLAGDEETREARKVVLPDGRPRLPPGQRLIHYLKPMGGSVGDPDPSVFRLRVHGDVRRPFELDFAGLLGMPQVTQTCDVHCVTGWSMFDTEWAGVRVRDLAERAGVREKAAHVIFEAAHGYTANVPIEEALAEDVLVAHGFGGDPLLQPHGAPARSLVPRLYFWKSAKWLTGIRFVREDEPGFWEVRGYHNHGDPWKEERYG
jgi:DMSO/TMAO reductase YedYZ molybdopterin-dependent catalytic subunit